MNSFSISTVDIVILVAYILLIVLWGLKHGKSGDSQSYFLAGRSMPWWIVGLSLFAASISSTTLIGQSGDAYDTGLAVFNYNLTGVIVMVFFAIFLLPLYIRSKVFTIPEFLEKRFDKRSRFYFSAICIVGNIFLDAAGALYAAALIIKLIFPTTNLQVIILIFAAISASYTIPGGLSSVIKTEIIQAVVLIVGSVLLTYFCFREGGDYFYDLYHNNDILTKLIRPMDDVATPWLGLIVGMPVLGIYFWANNQTMVQKVLSARSVDEGRKGLMLNGFLTLATLLIIAIPGLIARGLFPGLERPDMVYPAMVINLIPKGLMAILLAALLSALISTLSAILNSTSTLFTIDFYARFHKQADGRKLVMAGKIASLVIITIAAFWAPNIGRFDSLLKYYQEMLSYISPPIVAAFILGIFSRRVNGRGVFIGLVCGLAIAVMMLFFRNSLFGNLHFLLIVPFLFVTSLLIMIAASRFAAPPAAAKLEETTFRKADLAAEWKGMKTGGWAHSYLSWAIILLVVSAAIWIVFR